MNCENCEEVITSKYGSGRFCSSKCARGFSTKSKRLEINQKVSENAMNKRTSIMCPVCNIEFVQLRKRSHCSQSCASKSNWINESYRSNITSHIRERASTETERLRMKEIGMKGGFGKKGYTESGIYFQSTLEESCFSYLDRLGIKYDPHKRVPNSTRFSDLYLSDFNLWIELDGIDREARKKWLGGNYDKWIEKLNLYKTENLELKVIKTYLEFQKEIECLVNSVR